MTEAERQALLDAAYLKERTAIWGLESDYFARMKPLQEQMNALKAEFQAATAPHIQACIAEKAEIHRRFYASRGLVMTDLKSGKLEPIIAAQIENAS